MSRSEGSARDGMRALEMEVGMIVCRILCRDGVCGNSVLIDLC